MSNDYPNDLLYTEEHEWTRVEDGVATIGITKFAVEQLGDVTQVNLPREGEKVNKGDVFGSIESVKAVSDLFAPVSGTVLKVNSPLEDSPEYVNEDPYDQAWFIQIQIANADEAKALMDAEAYETFLRENED